MQAIVPAAGEGTRLRPLTAERPKGLVEVGDSPLLTHVYETLRTLPVDEVVTVVGYRGAAIRDHYGQRYEDLSLRYVEQSERLGLADAISRAEGLIDGDFVVLNGDNVFDADLRPVVRQHRETDAAVTALVDDVSRERAAAGGVFEFDADGEPVGLLEKPAEPPSRSIPRGFFVCSPLLFPACRLVTPSHTGEYELSAAIDLVLAAGHRVETVAFDGWCCNVNTPADVERVETYLA